MTKAIRIYKTGSSAEMKWEDVNVAAPGAGQVAIKQTAVGLNFLDVYQRSGMYAGDSFPVTLGNEGAGVVTAVGVGVSEFAIGDRVAYGSGGGMGAYIEERTINIANLVQIPKDVDDNTAAAMMLKGMTAMYLLRRTYDSKIRRYNIGLGCSRWRWTNFSSMGKALRCDRYWHCLNIY